MQHSAISIALVLNLKKKKEKKTFIKPPDFLNQFFKEKSSYDKFDNCHLYLQVKIDSVIWYVTELKEKLEKWQFVTKCLHSKKGLPTVCVEYNVSWFICNGYSQGQDGFKKFKLKLFFKFYFFCGRWVINEV